MEEAEEWQKGDKYNNSTRENTYKGKGKEKKEYPLDQNNNFSDKGKNVAPSSNYSRKYYNLDEPGSSKREVLVERVIFRKIL